MEKETTNEMKTPLDKIRVFIKTGRSVLLLSIAVLFVMLATMLYTPFLAEYIYLLGISQFEIGLFFTSFSIAQALASIPAGLLSDKVERKWLIFLSTLGLALTSYMFTLTESLLRMYFIYAVQGLLVAFVSPVAYALIMDQTATEIRGTVMSLYLTIVNIGLVIAPSMAGFISSRTGLSSLFVFASVFFIISAFLSSAIRKSGVGFTVRKITLPKRQLLLSFRFLSIVIAICVLAVANGVLTPVLRIFALTELEMPRELYGLFMSLFSIIYLLSQAIIGPLSDRLGRIPTCAMTLVFYGIAVGFASLSTNMWMLILAYIPVAFGAASYTPIFYSLVGDIIPSEHRGLAAGSLSMFYGIGMIIGPLIGGAISNFYGLRFPFVVAGFFVLFAVAVLVVAFKREGK